jgi:hypothetical protein
MSIDIDPRDPHHSSDWVVDCLVAALALGAIVVVAIVYLVRNGFLQ